jgi:hypothetical protein
MLDINEKEATLLASEECNWGLGFNSDYDLSWIRDSIKLNPKLVSENMEHQDWINNLADRYTQEVLIAESNLRGKKLSKEKYSFKVFLLNLINSKLLNKPLAISRTTDHYNKHYINAKGQLVSGRLSKIYFGLTTVRRISDWLYENDFVDMWKGSEISEMTTRVWPTERLKGLIDLSEKDFYNSIKQIEDEYIRFFDKDKTPIEFNANKLFTKNREKLLRDWHMLANDTQIEYDGGIIYAPKLISIFCRGEITKRLIYGGRFYAITALGNSWQGIKKQSRHSICINNRSTVEYDYSEHHLRLLEALYGLDIGQNPYNKEGWPRGFVKLITLVMMNCKTMSGLKSHCNQEAGITKNKKNVWESIPNSEFEEEYKRFLENFDDNVKLFSKGWEDYLCKDKGVELQYKDSLITEIILRHFLDKGILVLPIHDSYIIDEQYQEELVEVMEYAYKKITGKKAKIEKKEKLK